MPLLYQGGRGYTAEMAISGWFYEMDGKLHGPHSLEELRRLVRNRTVRRETLVSAEGMERPVAAGSLPMLFAPPADGAVRWLLPVGRSPYAIAAGYLGLLSLAPLFGYAAILFALLGIRDLRRHPDKSGWGRVIFALVLGVPMSALYTYLFFRR